MKSFKSLFLSEDQLDESVGPWRPEDQVGKKAHAFHRAQWDHHMDQKTQGKHKGFKQLQKGVIYQSNSGTWVGQRNGVKQREYFPSRQQAEHWVNGTMPNKGGISFLSRDKKYHNDSSKSYDHGEKEIPGKFQHAPAKMPSEKPKKVSKPKPKVEKPKQTDHELAQKALEKSEPKQQPEKETTKPLQRNTPDDPHYQELKEKDNVKVADALSMTRDRAQDRAMEAAELGIGAGNPVSQAGECVTVRTVQRMLEGGNENDIRAELQNIVNQPDHVLNSKSGKEWVDAGMACAHNIIDTHGLENIQDVAWDTDEGNLLMGTSGHGTAADMFVKLTDGTRVGVSLKKDGAIRIHNGGYDKVSRKIAQGMRDRGVNEQTVKKFEEATNTNNYWKDINEALSPEKLKQFQKDTQSVINKIVDRPYSLYADEVLGDAADKSKYTDIMVDDENGVPKFLSNIQRDLGPEGRAEFKSKMEKYHQGLLKKAPREGPDENSLKVLSKIAAHQGMDLYSTLRDADVKHFNRFITTMKSDSGLESAMKDEILHGMELDQILGIEKNPALDKLSVVYGVPPRGAELNEQSLMNMLGNDTQDLLEGVHEQFRTHTDDKKKSLAKEALMKNIKDKIEVDYATGAKDGTIKFIKDLGNGQKTEFPIFTMGVRTKGIGVSPGFEMVQTQFMGNALEHGFDIDQWPEKARKKWWNNEMTRARKQLKDLDETDKQTSQRGKSVSEYMKFLTDRVHNLKESYKSIAHSIHEIFQRSFN